MVRKIHIILSRTLDIRSYYQAILRSLAATDRVSVDFLSQTYYDVSVQSVVIHICAIWFPLRSDMFSPFSVSTSLLIRLLVIPNNPFSHLTIDSTLISILISSMLQIFVSYIITNRPLRVAKTKGTTCYQYLIGQIQQLKETKDILTKSKI